jgi:hypothetical protein
MSEKLAESVFTSTYLVVEVVTPIENVEKNEVEWKCDSAHGVDSNSKVCRRLWLVQCGLLNVFAYRVVT